MDKLRSGLLMTAFALMVPGCITTDKSGHALLPSSTKQVKLGGTAKQLGEAQQPALTADGFTQRIQELLNEQKFASARHLVERYPDVALEVLRGASASQASNAALQLIAKNYDQCCCKVDSKSGWAALYKDRADHPERYAVLDASRKQVVEQMHHGHAKEAADIRLAANAKGMPGILLEIDALQLTGESLVLADKSSEAVAVLAQAQKLAGTTFPHQSVKILLLLSDAERRAGQDARAAATWTQAAELAATLLDPPHALADPALWERLAYLRPVNTAWPSAINQELSRRPKTLASLTPNGVVTHTSTDPNATVRTDGVEAQIWALIGQWRFYRGEQQGALLAFKQGQTFAPDQTSRDRMELCAARALAQMNQRAAAVAILDRLIAKADSELAKPALAVLGSLLLNEGQSAQAAALLHKAVDGGDGKDWPGRAEAEADLGLTCLMAREEAEGLTHLHNSQRRFEAEGQFELLQQCLWNEGRYLQRVSKNEEAGEVREHSRKLEAN